MKSEFTFRLHKNSNARESKANASQRNNDIGVLGERGLLSRAPRGATCIAHGTVLAMNLSSANYAKIVENFHRTEINNNIKFSQTLEFMKNINFTTIER